MIKNQIQEERMRGYFIQATKEILKGEGLRSVNVRAVAERAGYSYATLYNYFKDIKELVFICVADFQEECREYVDDRNQANLKGFPVIKARLIAFMDFFIQYPGIFELFYLERLSGLSGKLPVADLIASFPARLNEKEWQTLIHEGVTDLEGASRLQSELNAMVTGFLLLYMNRQTPADYQDFMKQAGRSLDSLLGLSK